MKDKYATCQDCVDLLADYLDANLDPETLRKLDEHLEACPPCINFLNTYRSCKDMGKTMAEQPTQIPMELEDRLKNFLKESLNIG